MFKSDFLAQITEMQKQIGVQVRFDQNVANVAAIGAHETLPVDRPSGFLVVVLLLVQSRGFGAAKERPVHTIVQFLAAHFAVSDLLDLDAVLLRHAIPHPLLDGLIGHTKH